MVTYDDLKMGKAKLVFGDPEQIRVIKEERIRLESEEVAEKACKTCDGTGAVECDECNGEGHIVCDDCGGES